MICPARPTADLIARQIAADPRERAFLAAIPRDVSPARPPKGKSLFPAASEQELAQGLAGRDPEISLRGLIARVSLLEAQVKRLQAERKRP